MLIFTRGGDTPESITYEYFGHDDASMARQIRDANIDTFAWQMMNGSGSYSHNRAIWIPMPGDESTADTRADVTGAFDFVLSPQRDALARAQRGGLDIHPILHAHDATTLMNIIAGVGTEMAAELYHTTLDVRKERVSKFLDAAQEVNNKLAAFATTKGHEARVLARKAYDDSARDLQKHFGHYLKYLDERATYTLQEPWQEIRHMRQRGWLIKDLIEVKKIARMASHLKYLSRAAYPVFILEGAYKADKTWQRTHSWSETLKELGETAADVGTGMGLAGVASFALVVAGITAPVWVTCIVVGAAATGLGYALDHYFINPLIEKI